MEEENMKKIIALLLSILMVCSLAACASKPPAMDLSRDKNAEEMKWSPLEMGAAMQAHGA